MSRDGKVNFQHRENQGVLAYLKTRQPNAQPDLSPQEADTWQLSTHPDLTAYFWHDITGQLSEDCRWVVYNVPVLVHPPSGVIFGFAGGTSTLMLRLPETQREQAYLVEHYGRAYVYPNRTVYASDVGDDWALTKPYDEPRITQWVLHAYEYVSTLSPSSD